MPEETGTVIEIQGKKATVRIPRHTLCTGCHSCFRSQDRKSMIAEVHDPLHTRIGDRVRIEEKQSGRVKAGFLLLMLPLLAFIPGYFGGEVLAELTNTLTRETWGVLIGIVTLSIPWIILLLLNRQRKRKRSYRMHIVGVLNRRDKENGS